ncbi:MAG: 3-deoxy-7-phosphoheptulonate synthase, partial [Oscillospiraceae bacterium]|nr:3-deoxy-7-phosphoheptulonate synthase [Oscillospiraceae bacterium]
MITVLKPNTTIEQRDHLISWFKKQGIEVHLSVGSEYTVLGLVGNTSHLDMSLVESLSIVDSVKRVSEPYKQCSRKFHPDDSVIDIGGVKIGGGNFAIIAGPCSVESEEQLTTIAESVKKSGAHMLRGGAFKPRTSPYAF